ncbi:S9 family peptidase [Porticoccaceae bacterium]|nr:S9 family peptidase [Porticoccaceae bacterium]
MVNNIQARYEQAQKIMQGMLTKELVMNAAVFPHWLVNTDKTSEEYFWYQRDTRYGEASSAKAGKASVTKTGKEFRLVNANTGDNTPAFDHNALADALNIVLEKTTVEQEGVDPQDLPLSNVTINLSPLQVHFQAANKQWVFNAEKNLCTEVDVLPISDGLSSPDGKKSVFIRDHNLWIRDHRSGEEQALTNDGSVDNGYGSAPMSANIQALWSPDSQRVFTHQLNLQQVTTRTLIDHVPEDGSLRPKLVEHKMAYAGDDHVETYRLVAIDVSTGKVQAANYEPIPFFCMGQGFFTEEKLGWWANDGQRAFFVDVSRGAKTVRVVEFDTQTGKTRVLLTEASDTRVKLSHSILESLVFLPLPESNELIWLSERTGWAHLYLYDLNSGQLKHALTGGKPLANENKEWLVRKILHVDTKRREILIQTAGRDHSISPYYRDICCLNIDSAELTPLLSENYDYVVYGPDDRQVGTRASFGIDNADVNGLSPSGDYIVTTYSRVDTAPVSVLIDRQGREILTLETADVSNLPEGWQWPEPVKLKGADGKTDIYGVVYRPPNCALSDESSLLAEGSSENQYPIIDFSCGHPYFTWVPQGSFINGPCFDAPYLHAAALAALGFVVVALEGRGTPYRDKAFQDDSYGNIASASAFEDRIAGIRQLAQQYSFMDVNRVGIAADDGSPVPVHGLLEHPDFYKVGVCICYEDARFGFATLCEQFQGIEMNPVKKRPRYAEDLGHKLSGQLLLIHGMLDQFTPVTGTVRLIDALQQANKDFDMLLLPEEGHDIPNYALRRSWDYFVNHLQGIEPPPEFDLTSGIDLLLENFSQK